MSDSLRVSSDSIVLLPGEVNMPRFQTRKNTLNQIKVFLGSSMLYQYLQSDVSTGLGNCPQSY